MKLNISEKWLRDMADRESGHCISVGGWIVEVRKDLLREYVDLLERYSQWHDEVTQDNMDRRGHGELVFGGELLDEFYNLEYRWHDLQDKMKSVTLAEFLKNPAAFRRVDFTISDVVPYNNIPGSFTFSESNNSGVRHAWELPSDIFAGLNMDKMFVIGGIEYGSFEEAMLDFYSACQTLIERNK